MRELERMIVLVIAASFAGPPAGSIDRRGDDEAACKGRAATTFAFVAGIHVLRVFAHIDEEIRATVNHHSSSTGDRVPRVLQPLSTPPGGDCGCCPELRQLWPVNIRERRQL